MKLPLAAACALAASFLPIAHAQQRPFDAWLQDFRSSALAARISPAIVDAALTGLTPLEQVIERDRAQPEFTLDFRSYLTRVVSQHRIEEGQLVLAEHGELLRNVGQRYGIPPELLAAVWGVESNYGRTQGDFSVVQALATLAYDGRRARMFRGELLNALRILDQGHVDPHAMKGPWAGAMGQVQFMPSTFIDYAKDGDGDGRKNIWGSAADALESAANFMSAMWRPWLRWERQVSLAIIASSQVYWQWHSRLVLQRAMKHVAHPGCDPIRLVDSSRPSARNTCPAPSISRPGAFESTLSTV